MFLVALVLELIQQPLDSRAIAAGMSGRELIVATSADQQPPVLGPAAERASKAGAAIKQDGGHWVLDWWCPLPC